MNDATLTSILLSGAAADVEAVAEVRDDLSDETRARLRETVAELKDLHEILSYSSDMRDLPDRVEFADDLDSLLRDNRYHYDPADVTVNGPLALIQAKFEGQAYTYARITGLDIPAQGELSPGEWDGFETDADAEVEA